MNARQEDVGELVEYVERERSIREREAETREQRRQANLFRRAWWFVAGEP